MLTLQTDSVSCLALVLCHSIIVKCIFLVLLIACFSTTISYLWWNKVVYWWAVTFGTARRGLGGAAKTQASLCCTKITDHPSTASVPTSYYSMLHYSCLCTIKGQVSGLVTLVQFQVSNRTVLVRKRLGEWVSSVERPTWHTLGSFPKRLVPINQLHSEPVENDIQQTFSSYLWTECFRVCVFISLLLLFYSQVF